MGHKDKIRPTSLKCRISKIPNSQICAFCIRSMSVQSTGDNVVGMLCNEGDPVRVCMMWMDFGFPRMGFYCSNDVAAWLTAACDFDFWRMTKGESEKQNSSGKCLLKWIAEVWSHPKKRLSHLGSPDVWTPIIQRYSREAIMSSQLFSYSYSHLRLPGTVPQPCPFLKPHFGGCSFGMANANGERRVRPRIAPPDHVSPLVPWKLKGLGDACAVAAWLAVCSSVLS